MKVAWGRDVWIVFEMFEEQNEVNKKLFIEINLFQKIWK
jgi:hypothetical protein